MERVKQLTDRSVAAATEDQPDGKIPGLALRVGATTKSWTLVYRVRGSRIKRRIKLGQYPAIPLARARKAALETLALAQEGTDPRFARKQQDDAREQTLADCVDRYIDDYAKARHKRWQATRNQFNAYVVPNWGTMPVGSIGPRQVIELLDKLADRPATRRAVYLTLSAFFEWCIGKHLVKTNSASDIAKTERPRPVQSRDRVLNMDETKAVWRACDTLGDRFANFGVGVKLLLLTGQRRDQVFGMKWSEVNLSKGEWVTPAERMKSKREHFVPLSDQAIELLKLLPCLKEADETKAYRSNRTFVFSTDGDAPFSGFSKAKAFLDKTSKVSGWRLHDLRRTAAVFLQQGGVAPFLVEAIQGRVSGSFGGAAGVYQRYSYADEKRIALSKLADEIQRIVSGARAKVVQFRRQSKKTK